MSSPRIGPQLQGLKDPYQPMGIIGLVVAFFLPPIGLPVSIVAKRWSAQEGFYNQWALYGIYIGIAMLLCWLLIPALPLFVALYTTVLG